MGFSPQRPTSRARQRNEEAIAAWRTQEWPRIKKPPERAPHHRPHRQERLERTTPSGAHLGADRIGQTPVLEFSFNWQKLSAIADLTSRSFCFRLHGGTIRTAQVIAFLGQLRRFRPASFSSSGTGPRSTAACGYAGIWKLIASVSP